MHTTEEKLQEFQRLLEIMTELRAKCPWDKEQTFESLRTLTIEETYELADAIIRDDKKEIRKELGDILLHIVFYSEMGSETFDFDIYDVCRGLCEKLIYRHPHIFADVEAENSEAVMQNWESLKLKEKGGNKSVLGGVPVSLPALIKAHRISRIKPAAWVSTGNTANRFGARCRKKSTSLRQKLQRWIKIKWKLNLATCFSA
jgi:MazG family protein